MATVAFRLSRDLWKGESDDMADERRQLLNIRVIRVTLDAALRDAPSPEVAEQATAHALLLLDGARREATSRHVRAEAEAVRADIIARTGGASREELESP